MPCHYWGDEDFDWESLNKACDLFRHGLQKYARICCYTKEKYGTMRLEFFGIGHRGIYGLIYPAHLYFGWKGPRIYIKYNKLIKHLFKEEGRQVDIWWLFNDITEKVFYYTGIRWLHGRWVKAIFNILTLIAVKRWPHIKEEITEEYAFNTLLYGWVKKKIRYFCHWKSMQETREYD